MGGISGDRWRNMMRYGGIPGDQWRNMMRYEGYIGRPMEEYDEVGYTGLLVEK